ncbi:dihydroorotase [Clostridium saccharobutylicum]|uniref:Dihydroorotase n=1 Tax=Clostridium saccharobutylicum DSM 13864 TaxID=1345695 RepID=U5MNS9_CLOSA|nr:dihydroorotase [Clostridium saccharobutylicum]AGX42250.1 dihydroorotase PyrC [Clostridium saccharobutylicum DSM 13864]AQR89531.1 dihydroorotase [Clostridium saccharobutylicum]AQR99433.1 dihydroorotase [Clostridium saccharobutylicum]AQS09164.1 dihydroorotase [Clostridium saccharobutylicum]AQS13419.1 dihydroorotase [Clostridium saccharobutylicum]
MDLLIKNARIIDATQDFTGYIYIKKGLIEEISKEIKKDNVEVLDCKGKTLMPAFIDTHAHFRDPGLTWKEDIESGSKAALRGGYTGVCLMANTKPICSSKETLDYVRNRSKELNLIDIHQCLSVTKNFDGVTLSHLQELQNDKEIKAISDDGVGVSNSNIMLEAMKIAKENNWVIMSHAESPEFSKVDMRIAENMMTLRDVELAKLSGARLHMCHVSTKESIKHIIDGKMSGANVTLEVTPHHIALTRDINDYRVNPPIREKEDVESIIEAIKLGMVDTIGTDHAPHTEEEKKKGSPGMVGLETAFPICYTKLVKENNISLNKLSELMSYNPAQLLGMNKGKVSIGVDGDLVIVDLDKKIKINKEEFASKGKNTPFEGMEFFGEVVATIKGGSIKYKK